jgi:hypothetical protein
MIASGGGTQEHAAPRASEAAEETKSIAHESVLEVIKHGIAAAFQWAPQLLHALATYFR